MVARSNALTRSAANHQINKIRNNERGRGSVIASGVKIRATSLLASQSNKKATTGEPGKPILRRTSRLSSASSQSDDLVQQQQNSCHWLNCHWKQTEDNEDLLEHIIECHTQVQPLNKEDARELSRLKIPVSKTIEHEFYICLWRGCRVYGRPSCSQDWLERHMPTHAGSRPFKCFVGSCRVGFNRRTALEKHVNSHFNTSGSNREGSGSSANSETDSSSSKSGNLSVNATGKLANTVLPSPSRPNHHRQHFRKARPWTRNVDFFHEGIMEHIQYFLQLIADGQKKET